MITFEARDNKAVAVENGTDLRTWPIGSKNSMVRYIRTTGAEKFDLNATDFGKRLLRKIQRKLKADPAPAAADPAPAAAAEVANNGMVERTYVTSEGDSVTVVHPANPA